ncbi:tyrosine-type recombinase/integrase [Thalassotalea sp. G2M2-11]|uniref:tyrosine-type recombinase/integrase n=1 Tax=Thalassotalea sp. G2M2-11 TaxID=2787627 RepID=UPI0019CFF387|nr:tyrosine-type recombinase/integrase [Thalassotalea sp. G2M2-11]
MAKKENQYLKLRGNVWWYQRRVPTALRERFKGQTILSQSLNTGDIREARAKRDILNGKLEEQKFNSFNPDRHRFLELVQEFSYEKERNPGEWDAPLDAREMQRKGDDAALDAYTTVNGYQDQRHKYGITLKEGVEAWTRKFKTTKTADTVSKIKKTAYEFLEFLNLFDIQISDITNRQVHDFIEVLQATKARATVQGKISRLRSIWNYCKSLGEVSGESPFDGHIFVGNDERNQKQPFTVEEMTWIKNNVATDDPIKRLLLELGIFTGCRISELCNLTPEHVISREGVSAIFIEEGKTSASTRLVPVTDDLGERLEALAEKKTKGERLFGIEGKDASRWFSRIKTEHISTDSAKSFHSFRVMFATAMQQAEVEELKAAAIIGHKRGNTMTYGYYSKGYELKQLKEAYDKCVEKIIW